MAKRKKKPDKKEEWQKQLAVVAAEMNKEMGLEPEIDTELDAEKLEEAIIENGTAVDEEGEYIGVESTDDFTPETMAIFKTLGIEVPTEEEGPPATEPDPAPEPGDGDKEPAKAPKKTAKDKAPSKKATGDHYRREYSIFDAVKKSGKPLSFEALTKAANNIYVEKGGKDNITQSEHVASICLKLLVYCEAVTKEGDKYST